MKKSDYREFANETVFKCLTENFVFYYNTKKGEKETKNIAACDKDAKYINKTLLKDNIKNALIMIELDVMDTRNKKRKNKKQWKNLTILD